MPQGSRIRCQAILIVDDDADVREAMVDAVAGPNRRVFAAREGMEALSLLAGSEVPRPCLILLDWLMAPMNGEAFLNRLRERADFQQLPVVLVSASAHVPGNEFEPPGVHATLRKPFELEQLLGLLNELC